jgi:hypothetical protein
MITPNRLHRLALSAGLFGSLAVLAACGGPDRVTTTEHTTTTTHDVVPADPMAPQPMGTRTTTTRTNSY